MVSQELPLIFRILILQSLALKLSSPMAKQSIKTLSAGLPLLLLDLVLPLRLSLLVSDTPTLLPTSPQTLCLCSDTSNRKPSVPSLQLSFLQSFDPGPKTSFGVWVSFVSDLCKMFFTGIFKPPGASPTFYSKISTESTCRLPSEAWRPELNLSRLSTPPPTTSSSALRIGEPTTKANSSMSLVFREWLSWPELNSRTCL